MRLHLTLLAALVFGTITERAFAAEDGADGSSAVQCRAKAYAHILDQLAMPRQILRFAESVDEELLTDDLVDALLDALRSDPRFVSNRSARSQALSLMRRIGVRDASGRLRYDHDGQVAWFAEEARAGSSQATRVLGNVTERHAEAAAAALGSALRIMRTNELEAMRISAVLDAMRALGPACLPWVEKVREILTAPSDELRECWRSHDELMALAFAQQPESARYDRLLNSSHNARRSAVEAIVSIAGIGELLRWLPDFDDDGRFAAGQRITSAAITPQGFGVFEDLRERDRALDAVIEFMTGPQMTEKEWKRWSTTCFLIADDASLTRRQRERFRDAIGDRARLIIREEIFELEWLPDRPASRPNY